MLLCIFLVVFPFEQQNRGYIYYNVSRFAYVRLSIKEAQILSHVRVGWRDVGFVCLKVFLFAWLVGAWRIGG